MDTAEWGLYTLGGLLLWVIYAQGALLLVAVGVVLAVLVGTVLLDVD